MKKILIGSIAGVLAASMSFAITVRHNGAVVGSAAPSFSTTDAGGKSIKLSDFKGKYVVLEWSNPDCPYVHKQYDGGNMQGLQKKYTEKGVEWLTVYSQSVGSHGYYSADKLTEMAKKDGAVSTLVPDSKGTLGRLYGATNTPDMVVIDPEGNVIYSGAIDSDNSPDPDATKTATNYVAAALDASMNGQTVKVAKVRPYGCGIHYAK